MKTANPFTREFWIDDTAVREALKHVPKAGLRALQQARLSAIALESDRDQLRADLTRRLRENAEERERIDMALNELELLERAS